MRKSVWLLAGLVLLVGVGLDLLGLIPLGLFSSREGGAGGAETMRASGAEEGDAALEGRGSSREERDTPGKELVVEPTIPAEVHGRTKNGASIRGRAVLGRTSQPLAGVTVELRRPDSLFSYLRAEPKGRFDLLTARTGPDGRFAFVDITPSDHYVVRLRLESYAFASSDELDLRGGERKQLGDIRLGPSGGVSARVVNAQGEPEARVRVVVTWRVHNAIDVILADADMLPEIEAEVQTGPDGRFTLEGLEPGEKTLIASAPSGATEVVRKLAVVAGEVTALPDIGLAGNGILAGTVRFDDDTPVRGARVFAGPNTQAALRTVETGADGHFRIAWLPQGQLALGVLIPGLPVKLILGQQSGTEDVRIVFPKPGRLSGVVVNAVTGAPVSRFSMQAEKQDVTDWQEQMVGGVVRKAIGPRAFEGPDGAFTYAPISEGTYKLTVSAAGYPDVVKEGVVVTKGEHTEGIRIELPQGHTARGSVMTKEGTPVSRARLFVLRQAVDATVRGRSLLNWVQDRVPDARTRADGSFELPPQAPGSFSLVATHESGLPALRRGLDLSARDVDGIDLVLEPSGRVSGQVLGEAGRPATGQQVYVLYPDGTVFREWVDAEGRFELDTLPTGNCIVRWMSVRDVRSFRSAIQAGDAEVKRAAYDELRADGGEHYIGPGKEVKLTLRLPRRVRFSGQLHVAGLAPAGRQAGIWLTIPEGAWGHWAECDEEGRFEAEIESGAYILWASDSKGNWVRTELDVPDQSTFTQDIERD